MRFPVAVIAALLSLALTGQAQAAPCQLVRAASLDLTTLPSGQIATQMMVEGTPVNLIVDTGGVYSLLTSKMVDTIGLQRYHKDYLQQQMFGGVIIREYTKVHHVMLGGLAATNFLFFILPDAEPMDGAQGLLSPDILRAYDADFDFGNNKLNLFSNEHCYGAVVYWTQSSYSRIAFRPDETGHIELPVMVDGQTTYATLDTGASTTVMSLEYAKSTFHIADNDPALKLQTSLDGPRHFYSYPFKTLAFGGVTVNNPKIALISDDESRSTGAGNSRIILGMDVLRKLHLYIAYGEHNIYVTPADAH